MKIHICVHLFSWEKKLFILIKLVLKKKGKYDSYLSGLVRLPSLDKHSEVNRQA